MNKKIKVPFFFLLLICANGLFSQDTLIQRNGERQTIKVTEVNSSVIKYHKLDNLAGPLYSIRLNDVRYIKYSGGQVDSFHVAETPKVVLQSPGSQKELAYYGGKVFYRSNAIGGKELLDLIDRFPDENSRKRMKHSYRQMEAHRDISTASLACGLGLGCIVVVATAPFVTGLNSDFGIPNDEGLQVAIAGILSGAAMRITGFAVSKAQRNKKKAKIREIVNIYNGDYSFK